MGLQWLPDSGRRSQRRLGEQPFAGRCLVGMTEGIAGYVGVLESHQEFLL